jgi:hypothetical protein
MKSVSLLALIASAFALGQSKVASDYLNEPEKYEGKKIVLPCAYVQRASRQADPQHVIFGALTTTKGSNSKSGHSGSIRVAVPASQASPFIKKYGLTPENDQKRKLPNQAAIRYFYERPVWLILLRV